MFPITKRLLKMPREIFSIICDDIRFEQGNKLSLIGTYTDGILVSSIPTVLPKLCLAQQFDDAKGVKKLKFALRGPRLNIPPIEVQSEDPSKSKIRVSVVFTAVNFAEEGDYWFETYFGDEKEPAVKKKFFVNLRPDIKIQ